MSRRSLAVLRPYFNQVILKDQEVLASETGAENLLKLLPEKSSSSRFILDTQVMAGDLTKLVCRLCSTLAR